MFHVLEVKPDHLESSLNRLAKAGFEITSVTASASSFLLSGGGGSTRFIIIAKGEGDMPDELRPAEPQAW
jgi:hypothetical protein